MLTKTEQEAWKKHAPEACKLRDCSFDMRTQSLNINPVESILVVHKTPREPENFMAFPRAALDDVRLDIWGTMIVPWLLELHMDCRGLEMNG